MGGVPVFPKSIYKEQSNREDLAGKNLKNASGETTSTL